MKIFFWIGLWLSVLCALPATPLFARQKTPDTYTIQLPPRPDYSGVDWLMGDWTGKTRGKGPQGQVLLSVHYDLEEHFIVLREEVSLPATKSAPATNETLMGILSPNASGSFEMNLYSSSGFVTHYHVSVNHGEIDFDPDGGALSPPGWLFRRIIRHTNPGDCVESVEVAPPQQNFFNYYTADLSRVTPAPAGSSNGAGNKSAKSPK